MSRKKTKVYETLRDDIINQIGKTSNVVIFNKYLSLLERNGLDYNLDKHWLNNFVLEVFELIRQDLKSSNELLFITDKQLTGLEYLEKIQQGRLDSTRIEESKIIEEEELREWEQKLEVAKRLGNEKKIEKALLELEKLRNPKQFLNLLEVRLLELDKAGVLPSEADYVVVKKLEKQFKKKVRQTEETTNELEYLKRHEQGLRSFVISNFFKLSEGSSLNNDRFLKDYHGDLIIDYEHVLLLYQYAKENLKIKLTKIRGLLYYLAIEKIYTELKDLSRSEKGGKIVPYFELGLESFNWKKHPQYSNVYISYFMNTLGYTNYILDIPQINHLGLLTSQKLRSLDALNMSDIIKESKEYMFNRTNGILIDFINKELENSLLPYLLGGDFNFDIFDENYQESILEEYLERYTKFNNVELYNMYNRLIKPYTIDIIGNLLVTIENRFLDLDRPTDAYIFYLSADKVGIAVRDDLDIKEKFKGIYPIFNKIDKPNLDNILEGHIL